MDRNEMMKKIRLVKDSMTGDKLPNVYLLHGDLTDEEMNQLYNHPKVKAFNIYSRRGIWKTIVGGDTKWKTYDSTYLNRSSRLST